MQDLAGDRRVKEVVIADRNLAQARIVAETIGSPKVTIQQVDLNDRETLIAALKGADVCLNATVYYTNLPVMEACLGAGVCYTDMGGLFHTTRKQLELSDRFAEAGLSAVLGTGSAPGVPNVQACYAAERLDTIEYIRIYDGIKPPPPDWVKEIVTEVRGTKDGRAATYRLGTLTCKGALPHRRGPSPCCYLAGRRTHPAGCPSSRGGAGSCALLQGVGAARDLYAGERQSFCRYC